MTYMYIHVIKCQQHFAAKHCYHLTVKASLWGKNYHLSALSEGLRNALFKWMQH